MKRNDGLFVLAVTGGIASGKSMVTDHLKKCGLPIVDADVISKQLTAKNAAGTLAIAKQFGEEYVKDGVLDRCAFAALIFSDEKARSKLNGLLHPMVFAQMQRELTALARAGHALAVIDVPLLFESGADRFADEIWCVDAPVSTRLQRIVQRDGVSIQEAQRRIDAQMDERTRCEKSDVIIDNAQEWERTRAHVDELLKERRLVI